MIKLSIILPINNENIPLEYSFLNLIKQTIEFNVEIICVLPSYIRKKLSFIDNFELKNENVKVICVDDNGEYLGFLKNIGIKNANSEYVIFANPNYFYDVEYFKLFLNKIENDSYDIIQNLGLKKINNKFEELNTDFSEINEETIVDDLEEYDYIFSNMNLESYVFNLKFLQNNKIYFMEYNLGENVIFLLDTLFNSKSTLLYFDNILLTPILNIEDSVDNFARYSINDLANLLKSMQNVLSLSKEKNVLEFFIQNFLSDWIIKFLNEFILRENLSKSDRELVFFESYIILKEIKNAQIKLPVMYDYLFEHNLNPDFEKILGNPQSKKNNVLNNSDIPYIDEITVAVIMDPFTYNSYSPEFNAIVLEPDLWLEQFEENDIDLFICESAWEGVGNENIIDGVAIESNFKPWRTKIAVKLEQNTGNEKTIFDILEYCKQHNIPTVFWNKEDPPSFEKFVDVAIQFDYIFTTDENSIIKYKSKGHEQVYPLMFASQVKLFNPIENKKRSTDIVFAGSWYNQFPERCEVMHNMFGKIIDSEYSLKIYDRKSNEGDSTRTYPKEYLKYVNPAKPYNQMPNVYKESKFALNINTITKSNTMFARRIFELMSSNTFVLSNYSKGVYDLFRDNVIYLDKKDQLQLNMDNIDKICEENLYNILKNHTYYQRFKYILNVIDFNYKERIKVVHVFYKLDKIQDLKKILNDFNLIDYDFKKLVICYNENIKENTIKKDIFDENIALINYLNLNNYFKTFTEEDYVLFKDMKKKLDKEFVKKAVLHYQYLDKDNNIAENIKKYTFSYVKRYENILFNGTNKILANIVDKEGNEEIKVYNI